MLKSIGKLVNYFFKGSRKEYQGHTIYYSIIIILVLYNTFKFSDLSVSTASVSCFVLVNVAHVMLVSNICPVDGVATKHQCDMTFLI